VCKEIEHYIVDDLVQNILREEKNSLRAEKSGLEVQKRQKPPSMTRKGVSQKSTHFKQH